MNWLGIHCRRETNSNVDNRLHSGFWFVHISRHCRIACGTIFHTDIVDFRFSRLLPSLIHLIFKAPVSFMIHGRNFEIQLIHVNIQHCFCGKIFWFGFVSLKGPLNISLRSDHFYLLLFSLVLLVLCVVFVSSWTPEHPKASTHTQPRARHTDTLVIE